MAAPVRLQRYLAAAGVAARRKAEELITAGRVRVNGQIVRVLGTKVDPDEDQVEVDGEAVVAHDKFYVLFNKPKACITAVSDDRGRVTVMDYLPNVPVPVKPVGRLDFYSEGVLLLTNDGELAARLLAPASHVPKTYHVKVHGQLGPEDIKDLRDGITLDDGQTTLPAEVEILPGESKHTWLGITIHEGKHRQIHRMLEALGFRVDKLQRVAFANLTFHDLRVGDARELTQNELNTLRDLVKLDRSAIARGSWRAKREDTDVQRRAHLKSLAAADSNTANGGASEDDAGDAPDDTDLDQIADEDAQRDESFDSSSSSSSSRFISQTRPGRGRGGDTRGPRGGDTRGPRGGDTRDPRGGDARARGGDMRDARGGDTRARGGDTRARGDTRRVGGLGTRDSRGEAGARGEQRSVGSRSTKNDSARGEQQRSVGSRSTKNDSARGEQRRSFGSRSTKNDGARGGSDNRGSSTVRGNDGGRNPRRGNAAGERGGSTRRGNDGGGRGSGAGGDHGGSTGRGGGNAGGRGKAGGRAGSKHGGARGGGSRRAQRPAKR